MGELCNLLAMTLLQQEDYNTVLELLKKAEILTEKGDGLGKRLFNMICRLLYLNSKSDICVVLCIVI